MYGSVEARERAYLALYFESVLGSRYSYKCSYAVRSTYTSKVQYWLVHASDHLDAHLLMNDEIVKLETRLYAETYGQDAIEEFIEHEIQMRMDEVECRLRERVFEVVSAAPGHKIAFAALRDALLPEFFGQVKQGAYSRAVKSLIAEDRLVREQRAAAKLAPGEMLSFPAQHAAGAAPAA